MDAGRGKGLEVEALVVEGLLDGGLGGREGDGKQERGWGVECVMGVGWKERGGVLGGGLMEG